MKALIIQHVENEGPGTLGVFLRRRGVELETVRLYRGDPLPPDPREADLLVSMGGPMNACDDGAHPFLAGETDLLRRAVQMEVPTLGVCLGAQLVARAAGARVYKAPVGETGWGTVALTKEGMIDPVTGVLPGTIPALQWHEDTFEIPDGGLHLAESAACPHQAFRIGKAWGLQFHVEVERGMLAEWFKGKGEQAEILRRYDEVRSEFDEAARRLYEAFLLQAGSGA